MALISFLARFLNAVLVRLIGLFALAVFLLGISALNDNAAGLVSAFGGDVQASAALAVLLALAAIFAVPGLTERFFHGAKEERLLRGFVQVGSTLMIFVFAVAIFRVTLAEAQIAEYAQPAFEVGRATLIALIAVWFVPDVGVLPAYRGHAPGSRAAYRTTKRSLRQLRHQRMPYARA